jgi:hypothetical protein
MGNELPTRALSTVEACRMMPTAERRHWTLRVGRRTK